MIAHYSIRIRKEAVRCLVFEVIGVGGELLVRSNPFPSICKLEVGLEVLLEAGRRPNGSIVQAVPGAVDIRPPGRRSSIRLKGELSLESVMDMLTKLPQGKVVDERLPGERRSTLSGRLCDFGH